jgi:hypothetical protein
VTKTQRYQELWELARRWGRWVGYSNPYRLGYDTRIRRTSRYIANDGGTYEERLRRLYRNAEFLVDREDEADLDLFVELGSRIVGLMGERDQGWCGLGEMLMKQARRALGLPRTIRISVSIQAPDSTLYPGDTCSIVFKDKWGKALLTATPDNTIISITEGTDA